MRYLMRQKLLSFADDFQIKDEAGQDAFVVAGKFFSLAKQLSLQSPAGDVLLSIKQQLLSWGPTYVISRGDDTVAVVKKELFNVFSYRFSIELADSTALEATGNFLDHEYVIARGAEQLATVSKQWFAFTDTYGVDTGSSSGDEDVLLLAISVVVDMVCHPDHK